MSRVSILERLARLSSRREEASLVEWTSAFQAFHKSNQLVGGTAIVGCNDRKFKARRLEGSERVIVDHARENKLACEFCNFVRVCFLEERGSVALFPIVVVAIAAAVVVERRVRSGGLEGGYAAFGGRGMLC